MTLLNITEAARYLRVSKSFLYKQTSSGRMKHFKLGSACRFSEAQLNEWLRSHERIPVEERRGSLRKIS
jgi:excisionase family DNA binding protein